MKRLYSMLVIVAALAVPAVPAAASADEATTDGYGGNGSVVVGVSDDGPTAAGPVAQPTATAATPAGTLPFTGLDLAIIAAGGAFLIVMGFGARRLASAPRIE